MAQNSQGRQSSAATVTLIFPQPSNLQVKVLDAQSYNNCNGNSSCISGLTAALPTIAGSLKKTRPSGSTRTAQPTAALPRRAAPPLWALGKSTIPTFGVQFHTSTMDFVAQGCTGPLSCEGGQTILDTDPFVDVRTARAGGVRPWQWRLPRPIPTGNGSTPVLPSQVHLDPTKRYYISVLPGDAGDPFPAYLGQPVCSATGVNPG